MNFIKIIISLAIIVMCTSSLGIYTNQNNPNTGNKGLIILLILLLISAYGLFRINRTNKDKWIIIMRCK